MKSSVVRSAPGTVLLLAVAMGAIGCGSAQPAPAFSASSAAALSATEKAPVRRVPGTGPTLDRQGCDPSGKATVVEKKEGDGRATTWRYFAIVRRGGISSRVLKCEASDSNGDGYVDARYFYDAHGRLVLEQRDLDFDGHAEVVADYSHFSVGHLTRARNVD